MGRLRVAVLMGGTSAEREVSLMSGARVVHALDPARYEVSVLDLAAITSGRARDLARALMTPGSAEPPALSGSAQPLPPGLAQAEAAMAQVRADVPARDGCPEVVFLALHGGSGENGTVQGMLELLGLPYTGSGVLASALAMNKIVSKKLFEREGIPTPRWTPLRARRRQEAEEAVLREVGFPCVVKPACEGSSIGVTVVRAPEALASALDLAFQHGPEALAEEYLAGTEITGAVLGNEDPLVLPLIEIVPATGFYDYQMKYTPGATQEIIPARIPPEVAGRARELTLEAHLALGCRGMSRVDMMVASRGGVYVLEVNSIPGLTETSLVPRAAEAAGISFPQLVERLIALALEK